MDGLEWQGHLYLTMAIQGSGPIVNRTAAIDLTLTATINLALLGLKAT